MKDLQNKNRAEHFEILFSSYSSLLQHNLLMFYNKQQNG